MTSLSADPPSLDHEERFGLFEFVPDPVLVSTLKGEIVFANSRVRDAFGYEPEELTGQSVEVLVPAARRSQHVTLREVYARAPELKSMNRQTRPIGLRKDGTEVEVDIMLSPWRDERVGETLIVATVRDITSLRERERELEQLKVLKDRFLGVAAHDLRNPLAAISGMAKLLSSDLVGPSEVREFSRTIERASSYMLSLVTDLLDVSRIESGRFGFAPSLVDLRALAQEVIALHGHHAGPKEIALEFELEEPFPDSIAVDPDRMKQALSNLVSNAVKFSHAGSTVRVRLAPAGANAVALEVSNEGVGIPAHARATVFEPFQRLVGDRATAGERSTGLGLWIVRRIVESHGGEIALTSELGEGTTFRLTIPLS